MSLPLQASEVEAQILRRLDGFVQLNEVPLISFWQTNRLCLEIDEFLSLLDKIGFVVRPEEVAEMKNENIEFINLEVVMKGVETWRKEQGSIANFIAKQSEQSRIKATTTDHKKSKYDVRPSSSSLKGSSRIRGIERQMQQEIKLNQTLIHAKNQSDYELTIKIGEANDISKKMKDSCSYIINSGEGEIQIIEVNPKSGQTIISRKMFQKKYEQLKISSFSKMEQMEGTLQEDLKKTLVEVMFLSCQLQQQIALLQSKGISH